MPSPTINWSRLPARALQDQEELRDIWNQLNAARENLPFLSSEAMVTALSCFGSGSEQLLVARSAGRACAMVIVTPAGRLRWQTFQPSQIPLGAWVALPGWSLCDIGRQIMRGPLGLCLALSITQVDPRMEPRPQEEPDTRLSDYIDTGWVDIEGEFADYWAARGKNLRQNMRKQRSKLAAEGIETTMRVLRDRDEMAKAIADYGVLESAGWKAQEGTAIHPDNTQGRFYRDLLEQACVRGEGVVYEYLFGDKVVAVNLCLQRDGVLIVLKTTYDESIQVFSPASLLRESELIDIFREKSVRRIEYYGRLMEWHTRLTENKRALYHLTIYRGAWVKGLATKRQAKATKA